MISIVPRALSPIATAQPSRRDMPLRRAPSRPPMTLPIVAIASTTRQSRRSKWATKSTIRPIEAKNSGAKMNEMNCSIVVRVCLRKCPLSPSAMPTRKAPKIAWTPSHSVKAAAPSARVRPKPRTPPGQVALA